MCDSKSCLSDFTKYCPAEDMCDENIGTSSTRTRTRTRSQSLKVKNQVAWFSKKPKPALTIRHQVNVRMLGENDRGEDQLAAFRERSRSYVSQEELRALQGCVSRRRALFSLNQEGVPLSSQTIPHQKAKCKHTRAKNSQLSSDSDLFYRSATKECSNISLSENLQASRNYEHVEAEDIPPSNQPAIPDTISIQFRPESQECITTQNSDGSHHSSHVQPCSSNTAYFLPGPTDTSLMNLSPQTCSKSSSIPGWLNSPRVLHKCMHQGTCDVSCLLSSREYVQSPRLSLSHDQSACNSWPRNQLTQARPYHHQEGLGRHSTQSKLTCSEKSSPHHQYKESSLLSATVGTEIISSDLNLEIFGSTSSICSVQSHQSSASVSSERPHFHYGKGIDGVEFKRKTDVSYCINVRAFLYHIYVPMSTLVPHTVLSI